MNRFFRLLICGTIMAAIPATALADVVWPALYISQRMHDSHWAWAILLGLLIEWPFFRQIREDKSWKMAAVTTFTANLVSSIIGYIAVPVSGLAWEIISMPLRELFQLGTFDLIGWTGTIAVIAGTNSFIECACLIMGFRTPPSWSMFWRLFWANVLSVSLVVATVLLAPASWW